MTFIMTHSMQRPARNLLIAFALLAAAFTLSAGTATRSVPPESTRIEVNVIPTSGVSAYAVEEQLPPGSAALQITHEGIYDRFTGSVKWGPFLDDQTRVLGYRLVSTVDGSVDFAGRLAEPGGALSSIGGLESRPVSGLGFEAFVLRTLGAEALNRPEGEFLADFDADGVPLFAEYALGLDPEVEDRPALHLSYAAGPGQLLLDLRQRTQAPDVRTVWQTSSDLLTWMTTQPTAAEVIEDHGGGIQTLRYRLVAPPERLFLSLRLEYQPLEP